MGCLFSAILVKEAVFDFKDIFFGPNWPPRTLTWGVLKGSRGSKLKLKDIWHMGCIFSTALVKEVVLEFKDIFWDPTSTPGPFLGEGALRGPGG